MTNEENQGYLYSVELDEQPCVIEYVENWSGFLVGTYCLKNQEVSDNDKEPPTLTDFKRVNYRTGSLILLCPDIDGRFTSKTSIQCLNGGVFDFTLSNNLVYVAHANNTISAYKYNGGEFQHFKSIELSEDKTKLLTSIDTLCHHNNVSICDSIYIIVSDSKGDISIVCDMTNKILAKLSHNSNNDPIWQVKFLTCFQKRSREFEQKLHLIVGSEDQSWSIYEFDLKDLSFELLSKNQDFQAGVTSICFLPQQEEDEFIQVLIGSYDERLRKYNVRLTGNKELTMDCSDCITIPGGGIWRISHRQGQLFIAAMYAGSFVASCSDMNQSMLKKLATDAYKTTACCQERFELAKPESRQTEDFCRPLDYGVDVSLEHNVACIVDFNMRLCKFCRP